MVSIIGATSNHIPLNYKFPYEQCVQNLRELLNDLKLDFKLCVPKSKINLYSILILSNK